MEIANGDYWLVGSFYNDHTSEIYNSSSGNFVSGPALPGDGMNTGPCAVRISDELSFVAGDKTYIYDWGTGTFEDISEPDVMTSPGLGAICGLATSSTGYYEANESKFLRIEFPFRKHPPIPRNFAVFRYSTRFLKLGARIVLLREVFRNIPVRYGAIK